MDVVVEEVRGRRERETEEVAGWPDVSTGGIPPN
jgi:hypothetical protein